jgi:uncharacterized protein YndB with AHSA1/START domain
MTSPSFSASGRPATTSERVERSIDLDAGTDEVWEALAEPDDLEGWLGERVEIDMQPGGCGHVIDDEGVRRDVLVTAVEPGRRLAWHWWADGGELSSVEITLVPIGAGTRVQVVEIAATGGSTGPQARAGAAPAVGRAGRLAGRIAAAAGRRPLVGVVTA